MSRSSMRRITAVAASGALVAAGAVVGLGAGVAVAADTCNQSSHHVKDAVIGSRVYDRSVDKAEAAGGSQVTYTTVVGATSIANPYVNTIVEYPPAGFGAPVSAVLTAYTLALGQKDYDVTMTPDNGGYKVTSPGWFVDSGNPVTLRTTYLVPNSVAAGTAVTSGGIEVAGTLNVGADLPDLTACFTVRAPNAGEAALGSLDSAGLGSEEGQLSSTGSISDILGDTILNVIEGFGS